MGVCIALPVLLLRVLLNQTGQWGVRVAGAVPNLHFYPCPPGYCQCFLNTSVGVSSCVYVYRNSDPDQQCACGRSGEWGLGIISTCTALMHIIAAGYLCGECSNGSGVSALVNRCVSCSDASSLLIPVMGRYCFVEIKIIFCLSN